MHGWKTIISHLSIAYGDRLGLDTWLKSFTQKNGQSRRPCCIMPWNEDVLISNLFTLIQTPLDSFQHPFTFRYLKFIHPIDYYALTNWFSLLGSHWTCLKPVSKHLFYSKHSRFYQRSFMLSQANFPKLSPRLSTTKPFYFRKTRIPFSFIISVALFVLPTFMTFCAFLVRTSEWAGNERNMLFK